MMGFGVDPAMAEEPSAQVKERLVVLAGNPAARQATVYGAADRPLRLLFDTPLGKGTVRAPGVEVRRPPSNPHALLLIPSRAVVSARGSVQVVVPLASGPFALTLAFRPEAADERVRIFRATEGTRLTPLDTPGAPVRLAAAAASAGHPSPPPLIEMVVTNPTQTIVSDAAMKCRLSLIIRTPGTPEGHAVELRTTDRAFCDSHLH